MSKQDPYNITENEFIKGIAEGKYTPNDAVAYCRGCFDKKYFLDNLFVSTFALDFPMERERAFLRRAKEAVYCYLKGEGYKFNHNYENWGIEADKSRLTNFFGISQDEQERAVREVLSNYPELATERATKYIARAINVKQKYIFYRFDGTGFEWRFGGNRGQVRLGYFLSKAIEQPRPIAQLETLFGVKNLAASITNASCPAKRADVKRWRAEIDMDIFFD